THRTFLRYSVRLVRWKETNTAGRRPDETRRRRMQLQAIAGGYTQNVINGCMQNLILNNMQPKVQLHDERALGSAPGRPSASAASHAPQFWWRAKAGGRRQIC